MRRVLTSYPAFLLGACALGCALGLLHGAFSV
jgi:hypothetical protein